MALFAAAPEALAQSQPLSGYGIVVLHGKGGTPTTGIEGLNESLKKSGALVEAPELPWSARRIYDATYDQAMDEIDASVEKLKKAGAKKIAVIGHSLGANAAIGYAARRQGLHAVVALAPGHLPEAWALRARTGGAIATAKKMIADGKGDVRMSFPGSRARHPFLGAGDAGGLSVDVRSGWARGDAEECHGDGRRCRFCGSPASPIRSSSTARITSIRRPPSIRRANTW